jgi:hypothetical protein
LKCKPNGPLLHSSINNLIHQKIIQTCPCRKRMIRNILLLSHIHTWMDTFIWDMLSQCLKLNFRSGIRDKEEEELSYLKGSIAQVCQFKLLLTDWRLRSLKEKHDLFKQNQWLKKWRLQ